MFGALSSRPGCRLAFFAISLCFSSALDLWKPHCKFIPTAHAFESLGRDCTGGSFT